MRAICIATLMLVSLRAFGPPTAPRVPIARFLEAASSDATVSRAALNEIQRGWRDSDAALLIDLARILKPPRPPGSLDADPFEGGSAVRARLIQFLEDRTRQRFGENLDAWHAWLWKQPYDPHPGYAALKRAAYGQIDPRMRAFFPDGVKSEIRLDEIDWGGVKVNGIPPLRMPKVVPVPGAGYLNDSNVVFGLFVNGEARAYPKRILAWHEMALDRVGGVDLTIVYCTLCGTVIPYESAINGRPFRLGTSGLLYQSNKLMFDEDSNSLWSTFEGKPVVGVLAGSGLSLRMRPVVTTTWKAWRRDHPQTTVLSIDTGYHRDYAEGAAYRDYFATAGLMFPVSRSDGRLQQKDEVLVLRVAGGPSGSRVPVAIDVRFLQKHRVFPFSAAGARFVAVTSESGANRVYQTDGDWREQAEQPTLRAEQPILIDAQGRRWRVTEDALLPDAAGVARAPRVPAQRAFWFGWFAQFPDTILIK